MKKLVFLFGVAVGFLLGSKVGHEPYAQVEKKVREFTDRPDVQETLNKAKGAAQEQVDHITEKVNEKLPSSGAGSTRTQPNGSSVLQRSGS